MWLLWIAVVNLAGSEPFSELSLPSCAELDGVRARAPSGRPAERVGLFKNTAWLGLRAYQVLVSPADGDRCTMYPSCSSYAIRAVRRNGPVIGGFMATARIWRQHKDPALPLCRMGGRIYTYHVPEDDEWWR